LAQRYHFLPSMKPSC